MNKLLTVKGLEKALRETKSGVSEDTIFTARAVMFIAERVENMDKSLAKIAGRSFVSKKWWEFWK